MTRVFGYGSLGAFLGAAVHVYLDRPVHEVTALAVTGAILLLAFAPRLT